MTKSQHGYTPDQQLLDNHKRLSSQQMIDEEQFADMRELLEDDFASLLQTYFIDSLQRIELMRAAQAINDNANGFEAAHALKGASATLGAKQLELLCGELQEACRTHEIGEQADLIEQISVALRDTEQEINHRLRL